MGPWQGGAWTDRGGARREEVVPEGPGRGGAGVSRAPGCTLEPGGPPRPCAPHPELVWVHVEGCSRGAHREPPARLPACPSQPAAPAGWISLISLANTLMKILVAFIKLNQVIMRLSFCGLPLLFLVDFPGEGVPGSGMCLWEKCGDCRRRAQDPQQEGAAVRRGCSAKAADPSVSCSRWTQQLPEPVPAVHRRPTAGGAGGRAAALRVPVFPDR